VISTECAGNFRQAEERSGQAASGGGAKREERGSIGDVTLPTAGYLSLMTWLIERIIQ
jgi:hypothetical protein